MSRAQKLIDLCSPGSSDGSIRYTVVMLVQNNQLRCVPSRDLLPAEEKDIYLVEMDKKLYHAIIIKGGGKLEMNELMEDLKKFEMVRKHCSYLCSISVSTQTEDAHPPIEEEDGQAEHNEKVSSTPYCSQMEDHPVHQNILFPDIGLQGTEDYNILEIGILGTSSNQPVVDTDVLSERIRQDMELVTGSSSLAEAARLEHEASNDAQSGITPFAPLTPPIEVPEDPSAKKPRRKQFCIFCKKTVNFVIGHIKSKHRDEDRIKEIFKLNSKQVMKELSNIRKEGYKEHYGTVVARKGGKSNYVPCVKCDLYFSKLNLYRHHFKCTGNKAPKNLQDIIKQTIAIENSPDSKICENLKKQVISGMSSSTEIMDAIINDKDIVEQGNTLCLKFGMETVQQKNLIRSKLLRLAKVRLGMSRLDSTVNSLVGIFDKEQWANLMDVVLDLSKLHERNINKQSPSNVLHIGLDLSSAARDIKAKLPIDSPERLKIKGWLEMYKRFYKSSIGYQATKVALKKKWKGRNLAPVGRDIFALNMYVKDNMSKSLKKLKQAYSEEAFDMLSKCSLVFLLIFNRKRVGEITNMTVSDYNRKTKVRKDSDIYLGLSESEKLMAENYYHLLIRGKLARPVPLLISNDLAECIDILLQYRSRHGVGKENFHLFAKKGNGFYDGNVVLREAANECGATRPEDLTSTRLRKHIATVSQSLNMSAADLRLLSGYMGHTATTHIEEYTLPVDAAHATQVARILSALNSGRIHEFRGKKIHEIDIDVPIQMEDVDLEDEGENIQLTKSTKSISFKKLKPVMKGKKVQTKTQTVEKAHCSKDLREEKRLHEKQTIPPHCHKTRKDKFVDNVLEEPFVSYSPLQETPEKKPHYTESEKFVLTPSPPKKRGKKPRWTTPEKVAMKRHFTKHIIIEKAPTDSECRVARTKSSALKCRKPYIMKSWVNNQIKKRRREQAEKEEVESDVQSNITDED